MKNIRSSVYLIVRKIERKINKTPYYLIWNEIDDYMELICDEVLENIILP